jgi:hypothetical protein
MVNTRANTYTQNDPLTRMTELYGVRKLRKYLNTVNNGSSSAWRSYQNVLHSERQQARVERIQRTVEEMEREEKLRRMIMRNEEMIDVVCAYLPFGLTAAILIFIVVANVNTSIQTGYDFQ